MAGSEGSVGERLNKVIAQAGVCSRRAADELIAQGRVCVNGAPAAQGQRVLPGDTVTVDGKPLGDAQEHVYLMLNKPIQVVSTASDPQGRTTVLDLLPPAYRDLRLYPVGRLDYFSEGLLLLTNDGPLAQRLTHPSHEQRKVYEVLVRGDVPGDALGTMRGGMTLAEGDVTLPCAITASITPRGNTVLTVTLRQGLNRQIRRMCRDVGLTILKLRRIAEGPLRLGDLERGSVRDLTPEEVALLKGESREAPPSPRPAPRPRQAGRQRDNDRPRRNDWSRREARPNRGERRHSAAKTGKSGKTGW